MKWSADVVQQIALEGLREELDRMCAAGSSGDASDAGAYRPWRHTRRRQSLSVFEPSTEVIRKGKAGKLNEFGKMIKLQEAENEIIVDYEVYARRPNDSDLLIPAIAAHQAKLGRVPRLVATDAGFYSARNEAAAKAMGAKRVLHSRSLEREFLSANASRRSAGSATARNGAPDARDASVWSSGEMASIVADTGPTTECSVGSASV